jgi:hypothetical protein
VQSSRGLTSEAVCSPSEFDAFTEPIEPQMLESTEQASVLSLKRRSSLVIEVPVLDDKTCFSIFPRNDDDVRALSDQKKATRVRRDTHTF